MFNLNEAFDRLRTKVRSSSDPTGHWLLIVVFVVVFEKLNQND